MIILRYLTLLLLLCIFTTVKAQIQNNGVLFIGDNNYFYSAAGNYNFGTSAQTKTTRTAVTYGKLIFSASATWSGASNNHFIDGYATTKGTTAFILPVGQAGIYAPIKVIPTTVDGVDGAYFNANPNTIGTILAAGVAAISTTEYWDIKGTIANAKISLSWRSTSDLTTLLNYNNAVIPDLANLIIAGYNGTNWVEIPASTDVTSFLGNPSTLTDGSISTTNNVSLNGFTAFTLAAKSINALPVTLISFTGLLENNGNRLNWTTASEQNNSHFELERRGDDSSFERLTTINGNGTTNVKHFYTYLDKNSPFKTSYYRLKQIDFNGKFEYTNIVAIKANFTAKIIIYPNPFLDEININLTEILKPNTKVYLYDVFGRKQNITFTLNGNTVNCKTVNLPTGSYVLKIVTDGSVYSKVIVKKD